MNSKNMNKSIAKNMIKITAVCMSGLLLASCAGMSKSECQHADWRAIGYSDGVAGMLPERFMAHNKACAKAGITPNRVLWELGRAEGLQHYCTDDNAYRLGTQGKQLKAVCPVSNLAALQLANSQGYKRHQLITQKNNAQNAITKDTQELERLQADYEKLRRGENLGYATEKEARAYMASIPEKTQVLRERIAKNKAFVQRADEELR
ncbi:MAG: DUF2799 domain-containing protein [Moraxella sp.]|nr:DUF2799 domain-containing protein [Moraxella sp.]